MAMSILVIWNSWHSKQMKGMLAALWEVICHKRNSKEEG